MIRNARTCYGKEIMECQCQEQGMIDILHSVSSTSVVAMILITMYKPGMILKPIYAHQCFVDAQSAITGKYEVCRQISFMQVN